MVETVFAVQDPDCFCVGGPGCTKDGSVVEDAFRSWKLAGTGSREGAFDSGRGLRSSAEYPTRFQKVSVYLETYFDGKWYSSG